VPAVRTAPNPVLPGFHPDPSICRAGDDYYLACSSFEYVPGVPIFHSRDLVTWRQVGNALDRPEQLRLAPDLPASRGVYAPTIRHHDGLFYLTTTNVTGPGRTAGHLIVTAVDPAGPWSDPVRVDLPGVDPDLAWDVDGTCWFTFSGIRTARIDPATGAVLDGPWPQWSGTGLQYPEAPHLFRVHDGWYLLVSEGGTHTGHAVSFAKGPSPLGPFTPAPHNPVLSHRSTDRPVQATGHADLVEAADGTWWMVLLGIRQRGGWPRFHVLGRETFLAPVRWEDGWPVVEPVGTTVAVPGFAPSTDFSTALATGGSTVSAVPAVGEAFRDAFDGDRLDPGWLSPRSRPAASWSLTERPGALTLHATGGTLDRPGATFLGRRQLHHDCRAAVRVDAGTARCGLAVRLDEAHHGEVQVDGGRVRVIARLGPVSAVLADRPVPAPGPLTLAVRIRTHDLLPASVVTTGQAPAGEAPAGEAPTGLEADGPDVLSFELDTDGGTVVLAEFDGRHLSTEASGGFTGRVIGPYVTAGSAAFTHFTYTPTPPPTPPEP